jgi:hypothetical protein
MVYWCGQKKNCLLWANKHLKYKNHFESPESKMNLNKGN